MNSPPTDVERRWHTSDSHAQNLTMASRRKSLIDSGLVGSTEGFRESRRCPRDTYSESYITEYILIHEYDPFTSPCRGHLPDAPKTLASQQQPDVNYIQVLEKVDFPPLGGTVQGKSIEG